MVEQLDQPPGGAVRRRPALGRALDLGSTRDLAPSTPEQRRARRGGWTRRVFLTDLALTTGLNALTAVPLLHRGESEAGVWLLHQVLVLPLVLRRRHPVGVFAVIAAAACVQLLAGERLPADAALLLALYTVAAHEPRGRAVAVAAVLEVGVVLASLRFAPTGDGTAGSLVFLSGLVAAAFLLGTSLQTRTAYLAELEERARRLEVERDQQARLPQVAERTRIAREMHDIVAHNLSVMITLSDGAAVTMHDPGAASAAMSQVAQTGRSALQEMRQLLGLLRAEGDASITSPQPGLEQLEELAAELRSTGLTVRTTVEGQPQPLPATAQLTAYRAVQEAFTNTLKHGHQVTLVVVRLRWTSTRLGLQVTDDGQPCRLDPRVTVPGGGMGLVGMRERVAAAGGAMTAAPRSGQGWCVDVELPLCDDGTA